MMMTNKIEAITDFWDELFPNAGCELIYHQDYELVIAVMLSAQTTDKSVNRVTSVLFSKYPTLIRLANAEVEDIEDIIHTIGMFRQKAKHVKQIAIDLLTRFNVKVPESKEDLMTLSGVGNKTANVVRAELFHFPEFAVDTHVERIAKRLGLAKEKDSVTQVEKRLKKIFKEERYILTHHQMIHFGRYFCKAKNPSCASCKLTDFCHYKSNS